MKRPHERERSHVVFEALCGPAPCVHLVRISVTGIRFDIIGIAANVKCELSVLLRIHARVPVNCRDGGDYAPERRMGCFRFCHHLLATFPLRRDW